MLRTGITAFSICLLVLAVLPNTIFAQANDPATVCEGELAERIRAEIKRVHDETGFSGTVLVGKGGEVILAEAIGTSADAAETPLTTSTLFEIASVTKSFTGVAAVLLHQQGNLDLDASIADYLPNVPDSCHSITVRHLLNHTSGIPGDTYGPRTDDAGEAVAAFLRAAPKNTPGENFEYWNQGYSLLSEIIANASGKSYVEYCKSEIFEPCEMDATCFTGNDVPDGKTVAVGRAVRGANRSALDHPYGESYGFQYRAMGGIVTNVWDLWRFSRALQEPLSFLDEKSITMMTTVGQRDYALGWRISGERDQRAWWHTGGVRGFTAGIKIFPETDTCFFILSNSDDNTGMFRLWQFCDQAVQGKLLGPIDAESLAKISGTYSAGRRSFTIPDAGANPAAAFDWGGPVTRGTMGKMADGTIQFFDGQDNYPVTFEFDDDGRAAKCKVFDTEMVRDK